MKKKSENFKALVMAVAKVMGLYSDLPYYSFKVLFFAIVFGIPFFPIFKYVSIQQNETLDMVAFAYFVLYLIETVAVGFYLAKMGRRWSLEEYKKLKPDQITFPFILILVLYSALNFTIFYLISRFVI